MWMRCLIHLLLCLVCFTGWWGWRRRGRETEGGGPQGQPSKGDRSWWSLVSDLYKIKKKNAALKCLVCNLMLSTMRKCILHCCGLRLRDGFRPGCYFHFWCFIIHLVCLLQGSRTLMPFVCLHTGQHANWGFYRRDATVSQKYLELLSLY